MERVYDLLNSGLAKVGIDYDFNSLGEVAGSAVVLLGIGWFMMHLIFDD